MSYQSEIPSQEALVVTKPPANAGDLSSIPGSGRSPGGGNGNPLQDSCLQNPTDKRSLAGLQCMKLEKESDRTWRLNSKKQTSQNFPSPSLHAEHRGSEHNYTPLCRRPHCPHSELVHLADRDSVPINHPLAHPAPPAHGAHPPAFCLHELDESRLLISVLLLLLSRFSRVRLCATP